MGCENNNLKEVKKGSHFTYEQRYMLEWLWNGKGKNKKERSPTKLAALFGKSRRTIIRELKRGMTTQRRSSDWEDLAYYSAYLAQLKADENKENHGPAEKIGNDRILATAIADKIKKDKYSPYAVKAKFDDEGWPSETRLSSKTIYRYIGKNIFYEVSEDDLPRHGKIHKKSGKPPKHSRIGAAQRSIDKRPQEASERSETGHWEMDTVKGTKNGSTECLLTLTERKTRVEIIRKLKDGKAASVAAALDAIERELGSDFTSVFKSITADNGVEFSDYDVMERSCIFEGKRCPLFFAHPYRSGERGTNENSNGIIRRFFPKGTDFAEVSVEDITKIQKWMNHYPRKILNGLPPIKLMPLRLLA